ncbi:MAG: hypothetical protein AAB646_00910 [Patescibacteria group bacterium]
MDPNQQQSGEWPKAPSSPVGGAGTPVQLSDSAEAPDRHAQPELPPMPPLNLPTEGAPVSGQDLTVRTMQGDMEKEPVFSPTAESLAEVPPKKNVFKTILLSLAIAIIIGSVGALVYFVVFPLVFPPPAPTVPTSTAPPSAPAPEPEKNAHQSYFINDPDEVVVAEINAVLEDEAADKLPDQQVKEVVLSDENGQARFSDYLTALEPAFSTLDPANLFEDDFTAFLYYDQNGAWPGYVAKLKPSADSASVKQSLQSIENLLDLSRFYVENPGAFGAFKDGKAGGHVTRYAVASAPGAAFNYVLTDEFLLLSASYNGLKEALSLLGL